MPSCHSVGTDTPTSQPPSAPRPSKRASATVAQPRARSPSHRGGSPRKRRVFRQNGDRVVLCTATPVDSDLVPSAPLNDNGLATAQSLCRGCRCNGNFMPVAERYRQPGALANALRPLSPLPPHHHHGHQTPLPSDHAHLCATGRGARVWVRLAGRPSTKAIPHRTIQTCRARMHVALCTLQRAASSSSTHCLIATCTSAVARRRIGWRCDGHSRAVPGRKQHVIESCQRARARTVHA